MIIRSCLVISSHRKRRSHIADALRASGAVIVEAITFAQARPILRQLRFDAVAIELDGLGTYAPHFLHDFRADHPDTEVFVIEPVYENGTVAKLKDTNLRMWSGAIELTRTTEQAVDPTARKRWQIL